MNQDLRSHEYLAREVDRLKDELDKARRELKILRDQMHPAAKALGEPSDWYPKSPPAWVPNE